MRTLRRLALGAALAGVIAALPGCAVAQPVPAPYGAGVPANIPADWQQDLAPYGSWTTLPNYGTVWYPTVAAGWRPYSYGYWGWGPVGWTWFSSEPWGFTFHYGRWAWAPIGWVWVPGFVWGPAWVNWYWGAGYVGWAPLGYYGAVPWAQFVFVRDYDFCNRNVHKVYYKQPPRWRGYHHSAPPRAHIERVAHQPIVRVSSSQLPDRNFVPRRADAPRTQSPGVAPGRPGAGAGRRPSADSGTTPARPGAGQGRPPSGDVGTAAPRPSPPARPQPGFEGPRGNVPDVRQPDADMPPRRGNAPQARPPHATSPSVGAPGVPQGSPMRPRPYGGANPYSGGNPSLGRPPQSGGHGGQGVPQAVPPSAPRMAPPAQGAPTMSPPAGRPAAPTPSAPSGQFERQQLAPGASGFTGGARGFGSGRGFSQPGMR